MPPTPPPGGKLGSGENGNPHQEQQRMGRCELAPLYGSSYFSPGVSKPMAAMDDVDDIFGDGVGSDYVCQPNEEQRKKCIAYSNRWNAHKATFFIQHSALIWRSPWRPQGY